MRNKNKPDFVNLLNYNLSHNPVFENLYKATSKILDEQIGEPLSQLARIRNSQHIKRGDYLDVDTDKGIERARVADVKLIQEEDGKHYAKITLGLGNGNAIVAYKDVLQDRKTLINQSAFAGVDYYSDYISDLEYARLVDYAGTYWKHQNSGERDFINFIGFIKGMRLSLIQLWTVDQGDYANSTDPGFDFYEYLKPETEVINPVRLNNGQVVGNEYLTSHVDMEYDVLASPNVQFNDLINLFYYFAPIELVLNRIVGGIEVEIAIEAGLAPQIDGNLLARYSWEPKTVIESKYTGPITQIDSNLGTYLFLNNDLEEIDPDYLPYQHNWILYPRYVVRNSEINAVSQFNTLTIHGINVEFAGQSEFIVRPGQEFADSKFLGVSDFITTPYKTVSWTTTYIITNGYSSDRRVFVHRASSYSSNSTLTTKRFIDLFGVSTYEGISNFETIYNGAFDIDAFDDGFS